MSYNNYNRPYNGGGRAQQFTPYQGSQGYGAPYSPKFGRQSQPGKKRSGAKFKATTKSGQPCVIGWNVGKQGFRSLIATPISDAGLDAIAKVKGINRSEYQFEGQTSSGKRFQRWFYKIVNKTTGAVTQGRCFFHPESKKLYIPRLSMVASCSKNYFGTYVVRK